MEEFYKDEDECYYIARASSCVEKANISVAYYLNRCEPRQTYQVLTKLVQSCSCSKSLWVKEHLRCNVDNDYKAVAVQPTRRALPVRVSTSLCSFIPSWYVNPTSQTTGMTLILSHE